MDKTHGTFTRGYETLAQLCKLRKLEFARRFNADPEDAIGFEINAQSLSAHVHQIRELEYRESLTKAELRAEDNDEDDAEKLEARQQACARRHLKLEQIP